MGAWLYSLSKIADRYGFAPFEGMGEERRYNCELQYLQQTLTPPVGFAQL